MKVLVIAGLLALAAAAPAAAAETPVEALVASLPAVQVTVPPDVDNPSAVQFTASVDHALITSYELDLLRPDSTVLQTLNLAKPTPDATNTCTALVNVQPVAFGNGYSMRIRALAGTAASNYANSLNKFNRVPGGPTKVIAK